MKRSFILTMFMMVLFGATSMSSYGNTHEVYVTHEEVTERVLEHEVNGDVEGDSIVLNLTDLNDPDSIDDWSVTVVENCFESDYDISILFDQNMTITNGNTSSRIEVFGLDFSNVDSYYIFVSYRERPGEVVQYYGFAQEFTADGQELSQSKNGLTAVYKVDNSLPFDQEQGNSVVGVYYNVEGEEYLPIDLVCDANGAFHVAPGDYSFCLNGYDDFNQYAYYIYEPGFIATATTNETIVFGDRSPVCEVTINENFNRSLEVDGFYAKPEYDLNHYIHNKPDANYPIYIGKNTREINYHYTLNNCKVRYSLFGDYTQATSTIEISDTLSVVMQDVSSDKLKAGGSERLKYFMEIEDAYHNEVKVEGTDGNKSYTVTIAKDGNVIDTQTFESKYDRINLPDVAGNYTITVSVDCFDLGIISDSKVYDIGSGSGELSLNSITFDKDSPSAPNETIVVTANATGGTDVRYRFSVQKENEDYVVVQDWSLDDQYSWTPTEAGEYWIKVEAAEVDDYDNAQRVSQIYNIESQNVTLPGIVNDYGNRIQNNDYDLNGDGIVDILDMVLFMRSIL